MVKGEEKRLLSGIQIHLNAFLRSAKITSKERKKMAKSQRVQVGK